MEYKCLYCNKIFSNKGGLVSHEQYCKSNPNKIKRINCSHVPANKGIPSPFKGKNAVERYGKERAFEISQKISKSLKGKPWNCPEETNKKRIEKIKETAKKYRRIGGLRHRFWSRKERMV